MEVMCRVGTVEYSISGEHGGGRSSGVKNRGRQGAEGENRRGEWKKRAEKIFDGEKVRQERVKVVDI
jgi:hypothetical protein